jgi:biotin synthase
LKIETTDRDLYQKLHPQMRFENRLKCLEELKNLAYQVGSGNIVGLPGQSVRSLAEDIIFFKRAGLDMIGLGPFIPHPKTSLGKARPGSVDMTLKVLALARLVTKRTHMPASTALAVLGGDHGTDTALRAGANVVMPNFTGGTFKKKYEIYPAKAEPAPDPGEYLVWLADQARRMDRFVDYSRGDCAEDKSLEKVT